MSLARLRSAAAGEHGFSLLELLIGMAASVVVLAALAMVLQVTLNQERRVTEVVNADETGRGAMNLIVEKLHSSCVGFGETAIQLPSTTPVAPLAKLNATNLWFVSTYGTATAGTEAYPKQVYLHDVHWEEQLKEGIPVKIDGHAVGRLWDFAFGPSEVDKGEFGELKESKAASKHLLSTNVILPASPGELFQYFKYNTGSTEHGQLEWLATEKAVQEAAAPATTTHLPEVAKVTVTFSQAPTTANTQFGHTATFSNAVVFRFNSTEPNSETVNSPCE